MDNFIRGEITDKFANGKLTKKKGFSLLELLVTIGIIGAVMSISIPTLRYAKECARRTVCKANLKQIGLAEHEYSANNKHGPWYTGIPAGLNYLLNFQDEYSETLKNLFLCPSDRENKISLLNNYIFNSDNSLHASYSQRYLNIVDAKQSVNRIVFADINYNLKTLDMGTNH
jgi:prepilin-type N-terminal cleavage/methylation domain-containing protein